jgi:hypothetical protein
MNTNQKKNQKTKLIFFLKGHTPEKKKTVRRQDISQKHSHQNQNNARTLAISPVPFFVVLELDCAIRQDYTGPVICIGHDIYPGNPR